MTVALTVTVNVTVRVTGVLRRHDTAQRALSLGLKGVLAGHQEAPEPLQSEQRVQRERIVLCTSEAKAIRA